MTSTATYHMGNKASRNIDIHNKNVELHRDSTSMQPPLPPSQSYHRPPAKPSVTRAQQHATKLQRPAFRQKVSSANKTAICTTTSQSVGRRTLRELLHPTSNEEAYSIPIFQRRYCWNKNQWDTLWHDVLKRKSLKHSLGRLTCTNISGENQRSIIIDGQQRFTTTTLLLAAIRDALISLEKEGNGKSSPESQALVKFIHKILFLEPRAMEEWIASETNNTTITEGQELEFCRLVPTFCDRSSYIAAILPPTAPQVQKFTTETYNPRWHRPLLAKKHFADKIALLLKSQSSSSRSPFGTLEHITNLLLDGLDILYFPIDVNRGYQDGTEDTQVIYERLAIRDATWCKPRRKSEYHSMDGTDMIRNLCLGSFHGTASKTDFYERYWLPLERMFQTTADESSDVDNDESLNAFFRAFLQDPSTTTEYLAGTSDGLSTPRVIGGQIYKDFELWMARDFEVWQQQQQSHHRQPKSPAAALSLCEDHAMDVGRRLLEFAAHRAETF